MDGSRIRRAAGGPRVSALGGSRRAGSPGSPTSGFSESLQQPRHCADDFDMSNTGLVVNRWRRYGRDRLYVETPEGVRVGFWDLATDAGHPESPEDASRLLAAITDWKRRAATADASTLVTPAAPESAAAIDTLGGDGGYASVPAGGVVEPEGRPSLAEPERIVESIATTSTPAEPTRPWVDLATNEPGAEAREQALAAREAAPVKTVLARVLGVHTDERAWRIGADGEEKVAAQLAKAAKKDPRWRFLHALPVGDRGSDIDHLIIGPGGVFTVNAKNHPRAKIWVGGNTFMVNGSKVPYVRNARHEAQRAARLLTAACGFHVHVEGLIVTVNADDVTIKSQPDGVHVTWRNNLAKWLLRHGDIHVPETLDAVYDAARRSTTWRP